MTMNNKEGELPWIKLIVAIALISGALWAPVPLESSRPEFSSTGVSSQRLQNMDVRLWQDPFVALSKQKADNRCFSVKEQLGSPALRIEQKECATPHHTLGELAAIIQKEQAEKPGLTITLMQIMIAGDHHSGDQEHRRRMRYAAVSALKAQHYLPEDSNHLGLLTLNATPVALEGCHSSLSAIPYEFFKTEDGLSKTLLLWINEEALLEAADDAERTQLLASNPVRCLEAIRNKLRPQHHVLIGPSSAHSLQKLRDAIARHQGIDFKIYSPFATYHHPYAPWQYIENTVATDTDVVALLHQELKSRGLLLSDHAGYAVIGQWDTDYARGLQKTFMQSVKPDDQKHIFNYHFMRGIDGKTPKAANSDEKTADSKPKNPETAIERPEGDTQVDYLRRIAADLSRQDQLLSAQCTLAERWERNCGIRAIAIFGNDYYDKLLILKALKPMFPNTLFFTTDLEAAILHPGDNKYTRNLVVASSYGLELGFEYPEKHAILSAHTPPFREHYQTAVFLSLRKALCEMSKTLTQDCQTIRHYQISPFVFEIGRSHAILIQSQRWPVSPVAWLNMLMLSGAAFTIMAWSWWRFNARLHYRGQMIEIKADDRPMFSLSLLDLLKTLAILAPTLLVLGLIYIDITRHGEPWAFLEGVSIWPSEFMRLIACGVSIALWQRVKSKIRINLLDAHRGFFMHMGGISLKKDWRKHVLKCRAPHVKQRALIHTAFMMLAVLFLMFALGFPNIPARSTLAKGLDIGITLLAASSCLFLIFSVVVYTVYTTDFFKLLINKTQWSDALLAKYGLQKSEKYPFYDWIDLQLIARISEHMGTMIVYPVFPLLLLIAARSSIFEAWDLPLGLLIVFTTAFAILLTYGWLLRNRAEQARKRAIYWCKRRVLQLEGEEALSEKSRAVLLQARLILEEMQHLNTGAFAPISQQPTIQALFLAITAISGLKITEYFAIAQF